MRWHGVDLKALLRDLRTNSRHLGRHTPPRTAYFAAALTAAVECPAVGVRVIEVPDIRSPQSTVATV